MRRLVLLVPCVILAAMAMVAEPGSVHALGFNTAMLYRYPWQQGINMTRTQGQGDADPSHTGHRNYAVDWDDGSGNWIVHAANGVCPSVDANRVVNSADLGLVAGALGTPGDILYDLDANGSVNAADLGLVALRFSSTPCPVGDP